METVINGITTRESIINATLKIIGEEGFHNVTVRKIASIAGVNVAAVNYHFGSKDNVINEALKYLTCKLKESFIYLGKLELMPEDRLRYFLRSYADAALEYPDVFRNLVSHSMHGYEIPNEYSEFIRKEGFEDLKKTLQELRIVEDDKFLFMRVFLTISGMAFPVLLGCHMERFSGINYNDTQTRYEYVEMLLKSIIQY